MDSGEGSGVIPLSLARSLGDQKNDVRRKAAADLGESVRVFLRDTREGRGNVDAVIQSVTSHFIRSVQATHRKGGLAALSVIAVATGPIPAAREGSQSHHIGLFLPQLQSAAVECLSDADSGVRFLATETLFNIVKVARGAVLQAEYFTTTFNSLCMLAADSDPRVVNACEALTGLMKEIVCEGSPSSGQAGSGKQFDLATFVQVVKKNMKSSNPYIRQHLMLWMQTVENIPCTSLVRHLNDLLDGLIAMLSDPNASIVTNAHAMLDAYLGKVRKGSDEVDLGALVLTCTPFHTAREEHTRLLVISWISELLELGGMRMLPLISSCLPAVLVLFSDAEDKIRSVASRANDSMAALVHTAATSGTLESATLGKILTSLINVLERPEVPTRMGTLNWLRLLLELNPAGVKDFKKQVFPALLDALNDNALDVVTLVLRVLAMLASEGDDFRDLVEKLVELVYTDNCRLMPRAGFIVKRICLEINPREVYREFSRVLPKHPDKDFIDAMVSILAIMLYTSQEVFPLRELLRKGIHRDREARVTFEELYRCWAHNPVSTLTLCLLCRAYEHAYRLVLFFSEMEVTVSFLTQLDKLVQLLESPAFSHIRVALLEPQEYPYLIKTMFGISVLLPHSSAHTTLSSRLSCVGTLVHLVAPMPAIYPKGQGKTDAADDVDWDGLLECFSAIQAEVKAFYESRCSVQGDALGASVLK